MVLSRALKSLCVRACAPPALEGFEGSGYGGQGVLRPWRVEPLGLCRPPTANRAPSAPCPAGRASMDPTAPRNVAVTMVASATDSPGSVAVLQATLGTGEWP